MAFTDHPLSMNWMANQSSNSGCVGGSPRVPKLEGVATIPLPKWCCQMRLTITRAVRGLSGRVSQSAAYATGQFLVDQQQAVAAARAYLAGGGYTGTVVPQGRASIRVTVTITKPTQVLSLIGINSVSATGSAVASLEAGVTGPGA